MLVGAHLRRALFLLPRIVVGVLHHRLERRKQRRRVLDLRRLDEVHAIALVTVRREIGVDVGEHLAGIVALLERRHEEPGGCHDDDVGQLFAGPDLLRDLEQIGVRPHRLRLDTRQELTADEVVIWQRLAQKTLKMIVGGLRDAERVARVARPVVPLLDGHFADAREQRFVGRRRDVHRLPFLADADEARSRHRVPFAELALVERRLRREHVGRVVAFRHRHRMREVRIILRRDPGFERAPIRLGQFRCKQGQVVTLLLRDILPLLLLCECRIALGGLDRCLRHRLHLVRFLLAHPVNLREVEALERITVHGHKQGPAANHDTDALARGFQPLGQIEFVEQRADRVRHVLDDLAPAHEPGGRGRRPVQLDGLHGQVRDRARLQ